MSSILNINSKVDIEKLQTRRPSLVINATSNYIVLAINVAIGLLLTPFIIKNLGKTGYGIWIFISTFVGYYGLINLGVRSAITRYIALYAGKNDRESLNKTASSAMAMFFCTAILMIVASFFIADPLANFFKVSYEHFNDFKYMIWIMGLATALSFISELFGAVLIAHEKYVPSNFVKIIMALIRAGLVVWLLLLGNGLIGLAFAVLGSQLFGLVATYLTYKLFTPHVRVGLSYAQWAFFRKLLVFGSFTTIITIADHIRMHIDSFVIGKWLGMAEVGVYGIAATIIRYILSLIVSGMSVLTPRFSSLHGSKDLKKIKSLFITSLRISAFLAFGCCTGAIILGGHFIILWVGKDFSDSILILWILSVPFAFALSQNPGIGLMYALKKHHLYAIFTSIEAIANLTLSILLVSKYGIVGVALGTAIPMMIVKILIQPIYVSRIVDINILDYIKPIIPSIIVSSTLIFSFYNLGTITYDRVTIDYLVCVGIATCFSYIFLSLLIMNKKDKQLLLHRIFKSNESSPEQTAGYLRQKFYYMRSKLLRIQPKEIK